jgi:protein-S-isoprenylcysteine O-methyltransferase Ste14
MPRLAFVGYVLFVALAFGLRSLVQWRRTGHTGFVGISGARGAVEWVAGALMAVGTLAAAAAPLLALAGALPPWPVLDRPEVCALGVLFYVLGTAATLWSQLAMGDAWRIGVDPAARTALVVAGPFRRVRNPIYTGMLTMTLGLGMLVPNAASALALAALVAGLEIHVRHVEEPHLLQVHGDRYRAYAARAGRFLPGIGRLQHAGVR